MTYILITLYTLLFTYITWRRFEHGLFLFFLLLPTYVIRFTLFGIPTTLLEVMFWVLCAVWLTQIFKIKNGANNIQYSGLSIFKSETLLSISTTLFLLGATISIFTSVDIRTALGEWKAFYVEPTILFFLLLFYIKKSVDYRSFIVQYIVLPLLLCGLATAILAIYQHFTGWNVPYAFWENRATYRVTAWYGFPNGVGLFLAPLIPLAIWVITSFITAYINEDQKIKRSKDQTIAQSSIFHLQSLSVICSVLFVLCAIPAILFAKSTGALIGIAAGVGSLLLIYKKTRWITVAAGALSLFSLLTLAPLAPIRDEIFFQDRSGQIRLSIYSETVRLLADRPLWGAGLASYDERIVPYHQQVNGESIEIFHHPHNIFLTIWVNTGLMGFIGFFGIILWCVVTTFSYTHTSPNNTSTTDAWFMSATLITILTTGLVDSPYIKNDLAFLFWTVLVLIHIHHHTQIEPNKGA